MAPEEKHFEVIIIFSTVILIASIMFELIKIAMQRIENTSEDSALLFSSAADIQSFLISQPEGELISALPEYSEL